MSLRLPRGKGVFIWRPFQIFRGDPEKIANELVRAKVKWVAIKVNDGTYMYTDIQPTIDAIRSRGIKVIGWGYIYVRWAPLLEAQRVYDAVKQYNLDVYLVDAEAHSKGYYDNASIFAREVRRLLPNTLMGLCSFWKPSYHPTFPFAQFRQTMDFDGPQVYWRGYNPVGKLAESKREYAAMARKLPFDFIGGDLYYEGGLKPTPQQVIDFMDAVKADGGITTAFMWSMDQMTVVPELWETFVNYVWESVPPPVTPPPPSREDAMRAILNSVMQEFEKDPALYTGLVDNIIAGTIVPSNIPVGSVDQNMYVLLHVAEIMANNEKPLPKPLYVAETVANLNVRDKIWGTIKKTLSAGTQVEVWKEAYDSDGNKWAAINLAETEWVYAYYLRKV